jgi:hypothetical protein
MELVAGKIPLGMHGPCIAYMWPMHKTYGKPTHRKDWSRRNDVMGTVSRKLGLSNGSMNKVTYVDPDGWGATPNSTAAMAALAFLAADDSSSRRARSLAADMWCIVLLVLVLAQDAPSHS